jgi:hypothetical protein
VRSRKASSSAYVAFPAPVDRVDGKQMRSRFRATLHFVDVDELELMPVPRPRRARRPIRPKPLIPTRTAMDVLATEGEQLRDAPSVCSARRPDDGVLFRSNGVGLCSDALDETFDAKPIQLGQWKASEQLDSSVHLYGDLQKEPLLFRN